MHASMLSTIHYSEYRGWNGTGHGMGWDGMDLPALDTQKSLFDSHEAKSAYWLPVQDSSADSSADSNTGCLYSAGMSFT